MMGLFKVLRGKTRGKRVREVSSSESSEESVKAKPGARNAQRPKKSQPSFDGGTSKNPVKEKNKNKMRKSKNKKPRKLKNYVRNETDERTPREVFPQKSISSLARSLRGDEWERLAYALGFLAQAVSHFTGRASSAQNTYSQATLMLKTWRDQMPVDEILPRLSDALQRIRRHDLALKMGLELGVIVAKDFEEEESPPKIQSILKKLTSEKTGPPYYESRLIISDERISFLARQILAREEWKRLAYAIGFVPDEVAHIIARASSSQNLYSQAHMMLLMWRLRTPPNEIVPRLKAGFVRIRRHDLVDLLRIGAIAGAGDLDDNINLELQNLKDELKHSNNFGASIAEQFQCL